MGARVRGLGKPSKKKNKKGGFFPHLSDPPPPPPKVWKHILGEKNFSSISPWKWPSNPQKQDKIGQENKIGQKSVEIGPETPPPPENPHF